MNPMRGGDDHKLDVLFQAYRDACVAPEASANFMPNLWAKIESRQSFALSFQRMAKALTTAAVALSSVTRFGRARKGDLLEIACDHRGL